MAARMAQKSFASIFAASTRDQPMAWSLAIAIGLAFGMMPKGNLTALGLVIAACFLRIHYPLAIITGIIASFSVRFTDPSMDRFGQSLLSLGSLQPIWQQFAELPILPWFQWNNSIVMGSLAFGFAIFPLMCLVNFVFVRRRMPNAALESAEWKSQILDIKARKSLRKSTLVPQIAASSSQKILERRDTMPEPATSNVEEIVQEPSIARQRTVKRRQKVELRIDDKSEVPIVKPSSVTARPATEPVMSVATQSEESSALLQETVIEIVRFRSHESKPGQSRVRGPLTRRSSQPNSPSNQTPTISEPMSSKQLEITSTHKDSVVQSIIQMPKMDLSNNSTRDDVSNERPREEALRYLLWHLSGVKHPSPSKQERAS